MATKSYGDKPKRVKNVKAKGYKPKEKSLEDIAKKMGYGPKGKMRGR